MYSRSLEEARARARATAQGGNVPFVPPPIPQPCTRVRRPRMTKNLQDRPLPSSLRPHVLAADRFLTWMTPYGIANLEEQSSTFPPHVLIRQRMIMTHAVVPSTLTNYAAGLIRFTKFCDDFDIPENERMPASENLLSTFITTRGACSVGKKTMEHWLYGLELWHSINGAPWHGGLILKRVVEGAGNLAPKSSIEPKRDPVTLQHLQALRKNLDLTNSFDASVFAVACIAFWSCCRLGELLIDTDFDPARQVSRSTAIKRGTASNGIRYSKFHIPSSKTKGLKGDDINISDSTCDCSAYSAFEHHLSANSKVPGDAPLFAYETADGGWSPMRRSWFVDRCNAIWKKEGLGSLKGHGFRIGGTTHLLLLGIDPWIVMVQGRWSSKAFLTYWRQCEEILPLFLGFHLQDFTSILTTMSTFKARLTGKN